MQLETVRQLAQIIPLPILEGRHTETFWPLMARNQHRSHDNRNDQLSTEKGCEADVDVAMKTQ